ncbi:MAG TPA: Wzz/FepE/Etk N-terminal domain-containing protein, partial [Gemmatimonadaceae bacterium]
MDNLPALQPQSPFAEPNQEIDLRRAWATIARSAWIIVVCVGLAVAAAVVAARRVEPRYTAMATVRIEDANRGAGASAAIAYFGGSDYQTTLAVASELITSRSLASEVVDLLGLRLSVALPQRTVRSQLVASAHFLPDAPSVSYRLIKVEGGHEVRLTQPDSLLGVYPDTGELRLIGGAVRLTGEGHALDRLLVVVEPRVNAAEWLRGSVGVDQVNKDANVLSISYRGRDSALVSQLPNAIAHAFVKKRLELDRSGATAQEEYLRKQLATLTADVTEKEQEMRAYLEKEGIPSVGRAEQVLAADLGQLEGQKRELETQRDNIKRAMEPLSDPDTLPAQEPVALGLSDAPAPDRPARPGAGQADQRDAGEHPAALRDLPLQPRPADHRARAQDRGGDGQAAEGAAAGARVREARARPAHRRGDDDARPVGAEARGDPGRGAGLHGERARRGGGGGTAGRLVGNADFRRRGVLGASRGHRRGLPARLARHDDPR